MTTQLEISTVAAVKSIQTLRQQTAALTGVLRELGKTMATLQLKMKGASGTKELSKAQRQAANDTKRFSREMRRQEKIAAGLRRKLRAAQKATKSFGRAEVVTAVQTKGLSGSLRNLGSSAVFAVGPLSGVGARVTAFGAISARTGVKIAALTLGIVALGVAVFKTVSAMGRAAIEINKINNALKAAVGSSAGAAREFEFLVSVSRELSLDLSVVGLQFAQLSAAARGTTLAGDGVRKIFKAIATASLVLGLSADQAAGALRAIQQMMSKGTVQAEELRGQLGERIPGAFQIAARAMNVTTRELGKMLEQGMVLAEDLLPRMADELEKTFGPQVAEAAGQLGASIQRLGTEFFLFFTLLEENTGLIQDFADILVTMGRGMEAVNSALKGDGLQGQLNIVNEALEENAKKTARATKMLKAAEGAFFSSAANVQVYKDQILSLTFESIRLTEAQRKLQNQVNAGGDVFGPPAPTATFAELRNLPVASVDKLRDSLFDMGIVLQSLADPSLSLENKLGIVDAFKNAGNATDRVNKLLKKLSKEGGNALLALRTRVDGTLRSMEELREMLLKLVTRNIEAKNAIKETTKELVKQERAMKKTKAAIETLELQVSGLERLNAARRAGEPARLAMLMQLELETRLHRLNVNALSAEGQALAALIKRKHEALAIAVALKEEEKKSLAVAKHLEKLREKVELKQEKAIEALAALKQSNIILRMRIKGLGEEADLMELRILLEEKYSKAAGDTIDKIIEATKENEALKKSLAEVMEVKDAISDGFKQMGSDIASGIREGKNLIDVLVNSFGNLLEKLLDIAIQLLIIKPLISSLGLPGGGASPATIFGLPTNILGLPSAKGNVFQGGNVVPFRQGGVVNAPSNFGFNGGIGSIAEDGPEGILPLKRNSLGKLGVEASGMGGNIFNFYLPSGMNTREFLESGPQIEAMIAGTLATAAASNG